MASPWRYALEYRAVAAVAAAVRALPQWASLALGSAIGWVFYAVDAPHRRLTVANLSAAFPHKRPREIRSIARDLRPPVLDALGLRVAMQTYCTEFTRRTHLPVIFEAEDSLPELPDAYKITLYRTLQEALTNVIKHAQASQVWVDLSLDDDQVTLTIQDNGIGFGEEKHGSNGIGLAGLHERITVAGGTLTVSSMPKRGTILSAQFPVIEHRS